VSATVCPNCEARNSLTQIVTVEGEGSRDIRFVTKDGRPSIEFGPVEDVDFSTVTEAEEIECSRCNEAWNDADDLTSDASSYREHVCTNDACDWWGANPWQHAIERPGCTGEAVRRLQIGEAAP